MLASLQWLPEKFSNQIQNSATLINSLNSQAPRYLQDLIMPYAPNRTVRLLVL